MTSNLIPLIEIANTQDIWNAATGSCCLMEIIEIWGTPLKIQQQSFTYSLFHRKNRIGIFNE